jgi:hypothetical protein
LKDSVQIMICLSGGTDVERTLDKLPTSLVNNKKKLPVFLFLSRVSNKKIISKILTRNLVFYCLRIAYL